MQYKSKRGSMLVPAMIILFTVLFMGAALITMGLWSVQSSVNSSDGSQAYYGAKMLADAIANNLEGTLKSTNTDAQKLDAKIASLTVDGTPLELAPEITFKTADETGDSVANLNADYAYELSIKCTARDDTKGTQDIAIKATCTYTGAGFTDTSTDESTSYTRSVTRNMTITRSTSDAGYGMMANRVSNKGSGLQNYVHNSVIYGDVWVNNEIDNNGTGSPVIIEGVTVYDGNLNVYNPKSTIKLQDVKLLSTDTDKASGTATLIVEKGGVGSPAPNYDIYVYTSLMENLKMSSGVRNYSGVFKKFNPGNAIYKIGATSNDISKTITGDLYIQNYEKYEDDTDPKTRIFGDSSLQTTTVRDAAQISDVIGDWYKKQDLSCNIVSKCYDDSGDNITFAYQDTINISQNSVIKDDIYHSPINVTANPGETIWVYFTNADKIEFAKPITVSGGGTVNFVFHNDEGKPIIFNGGTGCTISRNDNTTFNIICTGDNQSTGDEPKRSAEIRFEGNMHGTVEANIINPHGLIFINNIGEATTKNDLSTAVHGSIWADAITVEGSTLSTKPIEANYWGDVSSVLEITGRDGSAVTSNITYENKTPKYS